MTKPTKFAFHINYIFVSILIVIVTVFAFYFLKYIPEQEQVLNQKYINDLKLIQSIVTTKLSTTQNAITNGVKKKSNEEIKDYLNQKIPEIKEFVSKDTAYYKETHFSNYGKNATINFRTTNDKFAKVEFSRLIQTLLSSTSFDHIVMSEVKSDSLKIIYQTLDLPIITKGDSLLLTDKHITNTLTMRVTLSGTNYLAYISRATLESTKNPIHIYGLVKTEQLDKEKQQVSSQTIVLMLFLLLFIFLALPFAKMALISKTESIQVTDIFSLVVSIVFGTCLFVLLITNSVLYLGPDREKKIQELVLLSETIENEFISDIQSALRLLDKEEEHLQLNGIKSDNGQLHLANVALNTSKLPFVQIYWTNKNGDQRIKHYRKENFRTNQINLKERSYIKKIKKNKGWKTPYDTFYLQSINSWSDGRAVAAISKKSNISDTLDIVCMTTLLPSLMNAILPEGIGFALIDESGKVHFHSNPNKNLSEDFFQETSLSPEFKSAVSLRASNSFENIKYQGKNYFMHVSPIQDLPFYLVSFSSKELGKSLNAQIYSVSFLCFLIFGGLSLIGLLIQRSFRSRSSKLKIKGFPFNWLRPTIKNNELYKKQILYQLLIIFCLIAFYMTNDQIIDNFLMYAIVSILVYETTFLGLTRSSPSDILKYWKSHLLPVSMLSIFSVLSIYYAAYYIPIIIPVFAIIALLIHRLDRYSFLRVLTIDYRKSFNLMLVMWLIIGVVLPTISIYRFVYNIENELSTKYQQILTLNRVEEVYGQVGDSTEVGYDYLSYKDATFMIKNDKWDNIDSNTFIKRKHLLDDNLLKFGKNTISSENKLKFALKELKDNNAEVTSQQYKENHTGELGAFAKYSLLRPKYNEIILATSQITGDNHYKSWTKYKNGYLYSRLQNGAYTHLYTESSSLNNLSLKTLLLILFLFVTIGTIIYLIINYTIRRLFLLPRLHKNIFTPDVIHSVLAADHKKRLLLVGLPGSGKRTMIETACDDSKTIRLSAMNLEKGLDMDTLESKLPQVKNLIILNLEYVNNNDEALKALIALLKLSIVFKDLKIIISSSIEVEQIFTSPETHDQLCFLFGSFYNVVVPLGNVKEEESGNTYLEKLVYNEIIACKFLNNIKGRMNKWIQETKDQWKHDPKNFRDHIILRVQSLSQNYYRSIWNQCSPMEQFVIHDLARDLLVNSKNIDVIDRLLSKGVFKFENNELNIMNDSFRNFVINHTNNQMILNRLTDERHTSSWNKYRQTILLILVSLAGFIFLTQEETFNLLFATLSSITAGIPLLIQIINMINGRSNKSKA